MTDRVESSLGNGSRLVSFTTLSLLAAFSMPLTILFLSQSLWPNASFASVKPDVQDAKFTFQVFSQDPLILYIKDFLTSDEITHMLTLA